MFGTGVAASILYILIGELLILLKQCFSVRAVWVVKRSLETRLAREELGGDWLLEVEVAARKGLAQPGGPPPHLAVLSSSCRRTTACYNES